MAADIATDLAGLAGTEEGRVPLDVGAGGDRTAVVDRRAEDVVIAHCEALAAAGVRFLLRSEELGDRAFGASHPVLLVDPVDGSLNAMHGIPYYCTSLCVVDGDRVEDAAVAVVRSLAVPRVYAAVRGEGATRDGVPLRPLAVGLDERGRIPMLLIEGMNSVRKVSALTPLLAATRRLRLLGSAALSLCQVAAGSASALVAPSGMRAYDCAAALLLLRESAAVVTDIDGRPLDDRVLDLTARLPIVASLSPEVHERTLRLLSEGGLR
ncbi:MAG: monophosphatase [Chloroflexota bacterium]|nr:monophosphatase [Chloroflexota bacterium]